MFERIIVKEDDDKRGRDRGEAADLIIKGLLSEKPQAHYEAILDETEAINYGLDKVDKGGLVVVFPESVTRAISLISQRNVIS